MVFQISNDLNLQKLAQVSHSYAFETPEIEIHDFNSFLFNSLIFHFEIHTAAEAKDNPKDLFHQSFWVLAKGLTQVMAQHLMLD